MTGALAPLWAWIDVTVISGIALLWVYWSEIKAAWHKVRPVKSQPSVTTNWHEFDSLPLRYAACDARQDHYTGF